MNTKKCNICNYNFTSCKRIPISCEQCKTVNCLNCFENWLIEPLNIQVCMHCKEPINNLVIWRNCTKKFLKLYFKKLGYLELEEQKKLMIRLKERQLLKKLNKELERRETTLRLLFKKNKTDKETLEQMYEVSKKILENNIILEKDDDSHKITKCLILECSGYLVKNKCILCNIVVCGKCNEVKNLNHICNPESVKSVQEIKKSTKKCPKCDVSIHKIDGCDQMFCVQCHTAFSWSTNKIDTSKYIHNPHYFEYISKIQQSYQIYDENEPLNKILNEIILKQITEMFYIPRLIQECSAVLTALNNFIFNQNVIKIYREQNVKSYLKDKANLEKLWLKNTTFYVKKKFLCLDVLDILSKYLQKIKNIIVEMDPIVKNKEIELEHAINQLNQIYDSKLLNLEKKHKVLTKTRLTNFQCNLVHWDNNEIFI